MSTDHVVMDAQRQVFRCTRCGAEFIPPLPAPMNAFIALARVFTDLHHACQKAQKGGKK